MLNSIKYDEKSAKVNETIKARFEEAYEALREHLGASREKSLALTKLEESFMWVGKAIKHDQLLREDGQE
jgi:hypothetical protein